MSTSTPRLGRAPRMAPSRHRHKMVPDGCPLSPREFELVQLFAAGKTYKRVALEWRRAVSTVRTMACTAYARLGVNDRAQAVILCSRAGWLDVVDTAWEDKRATAAQSSYLAAFDRYLSTSNDGDRDRMRRALGVMHDERDLPLREARATEDPIMRLLTSMATTARR